MSFYRTYRPQIIEEIDNAFVAGQLQNLLTKKREELPHAYLFSGPRGAGKTTAARIVAKIFNCTERKSKEGPCGTCGQCTSIANGTNMDVIEIDAASNRGIDEMRLLRERIGFTPSQAKFTVYIIDEVHMLTTEAFNALLKTLEEPPAHAVFVMATTEEHKVLPTIKSRCMTVSFTQAGSKELHAALDRIVKKEKITIDEDALNAICNSADGSFRDAVKFLEQVSLASKHITEDVVNATLSLSNASTISQFLHALETKNAKKALFVISDIQKTGRDIRLFTVDIVKTLEEQLIGRISSNEKNQGFSLPELTQLITLLTRAWIDMKASPIAAIPLEIAVVTFCGQTEEPKPESKPETRIAEKPKEELPETVDEHAQI